MYKPLQLSKKLEKFLQICFDFFFFYNKGSSPINFQVYNFYFSWVMWVQTDAGEIFVRVRKLTSFSFSCKYKKKKNLLNWFCPNFSKYSPLGWEEKKKILVQRIFFYEVINYWNIYLSSKSLTTLNSVFTNTKVDILE